MHQLFHLAFSPFQLSQPSFAKVKHVCLLARFLTSSPHSSPSPTLPLSLSQICRNCVIPCSRTWSAYFSASFHANGVPSARRPIAAGQLSFSDSYFLLFLQYQFMLDSAGLYCIALVIDKRSTYYQRSP